MKKGFTLVEFILYISIVGVILVSFMYYMIDISTSSTKSDAVIEVGQNGRVAMEKISREIRNAVSINTVASSALSLKTLDPNTDPTVIDLSGTTLQIKRGTGSVLPITTSKVEVTSLIFSNLSQASTPGNIKIVLELRYKNPQNIDALNASTVLESSVSLRQ